MLDPELPDMSIGGDFADSQPRSAEASDAPKTWTCSLCKNVNYEHLTHCASCSAVKGSPSQPGSNEELTELERIAVIIQMNTTLSAASLIQALLTTRERNLLNKLSLYIPDESMIAGTGGKTGDEYWRAVGHAEGVKELADTIYRFIARETATLAESKETGV